MGRLLLEEPLKSKILIILRVKRDALIRNTRRGSTALCVGVELVPGVPERGQTGSITETRC